jgi:2-iminobutanoate/2-iminopropanoate deaminase
MLMRPAFEKRRGTKSRLPPTIIFQNDGRTGARGGAALSINRRNIQPETLHQRRVDDRVLYSHVVSVEPRRLIFISGQLARDKDGRIIGVGDMRAQLRQTLENIKAALEAAGASLSDLVRTNTYVTNIDEYFKHTDVRMEYYSHAMPTSTTVEVRRLAQPELMVEIDAIAAVG